MSLTDVGNSGPGALALLADLERSGMVTERALLITDPDLPFEQWEALGGFFGEAKTRLSFYLGDWLNFGEGLYGERFAQALSATGYVERTLYNYSSVCKRVPARRRSKDPDYGTFGHHDAVAALSPQEQTFWLREAVKKQLSVRDLRDAIRRATNPEPEVTVLPLEPLSAPAIATAAGDLVVLKETVERAELPKADKARVEQALMRSSETLRVAATIPTLRELVESLIADAIPYDPEDGGQTYYLVPTATLDELRSLVGEEARV